MEHGKAVKIVQEQEKNNKIVEAVYLHADDFINGVVKDIKKFLANRGDQDADVEADKLKAELDKFIDDFISTIQNR